jgi:NAD(P)-dependent dehydrogenase (short-subunit alcohol dehydrogenase family)
MELKNSVCIVTGSATGIGAACAIQLAQRGCRTVINYTKSETEARDTLKACERHGSEALLVRANVAEDADCRRMAEAALAKWGRIDALVNNAGTTKVAFNHAELNALSAADFQHVYGVNVVCASRAPVRWSTSLRSPRSWESARRSRMRRPRAR